MRDARRAPAKSRPAAARRTAFASVLERDLFASRSAAPAFLASLPGTLRLSLSVVMLWRCADRFYALAKP